MRTTDSTTAHPATHPATHSVTRTAAQAVLGTAIGLVALGGFGAAANAETPVEPAPIILVAPGDVDPEPTPPPAAGTELVTPPIDPGPDPVDVIDDLVLPLPDPGPGPIDDFTTPTQDPDPGDGPDDLGVPEGCDETEVCEPDPEDDCPELAANCDFRTPPGTPDDDDTPEDTPEDDTPSDDPGGNLPYTGGGAAQLALIGTGVTGLGVALRRLAARR